jgi:DNA-binding transcriptional MerR regulator
MWSKGQEIRRKEKHYHYHKTGSFYSLSEACKAIGISRVTFRRYEGKLFPHIMRDEAGRRLFSREDIEQIKEIWENHKKGK